MLHSDSLDHVAVVHRSPAGITAGDFDNITTSKYEPPKT